MRKRITTRGTQGIIPPDEDWLDLENLAQAELTSEDASHPIESALKPGMGRAGGRQNPVSRQFGCCLTSRGGSGVFI